MRTKEQWEQLELLNELKTKIEILLEAFEEYPHKQTSEFTRARTALKDFVRYGHWGVDETG